MPKTTSCLFFGCWTPLAFSSSWDLRDFRANRKRTNVRTLIAFIACMPFALGVRTRIPSECNPTFLHRSSPEPPDALKFQLVLHSDSVVQFPDAYSLYALALSAAFKLLLADALLFNPPLISLACPNELSIGPESYRLIFVC